MAKVRGRRSAKQEEKEESKKYVRIESSKPKQEEEVKQESQINTPFFGLVDSNELDYFKTCESTLNINAFDNEEEKRGFINSIFEEAKGKELKLVTNQICSKLVERLILESTDIQLKNLFKCFSGHFVPLAHHKYSSHCLETLLVRSAALIEKELINQDEDSIIETEQDGYVSMENLFLFMLGEIKPHLNAMISHQYSSHLLRLLLLIISAGELPSSILVNSTLRSKRSKIARKMIEIKDNDDFNKKYQVPPSFKGELSNILKIIIKDQDRIKLRELAIHKVASPVIQLIIQVEGIVDKERSFWHLIFNSVDQPADPKEESFIEYLLSDSIGSHFLESCIKCERPRYIERLFKLYMSDRIVKLAKRDTTGSFVIRALILKLKPNEILKILDTLIPELSELINNNLELGQTIIDASIHQNNHLKDEIIQQILKKYSTDKDEDFLEIMLNLSTSTLGNTRDDWPTSEERRRSIFLEKLIEYDLTFLNKTLLSLLSLPKERLLQMCYHGVFSHVVESVLVFNVDNILKRRMVNNFMGEITRLSCNSYGSHVVDKLWEFTTRLNVYKERIAAELFANKDVIKESTYGKLVWKNWSMELFTRRKLDWKNLIKTQEIEFFKESKKPIDLKFEALQEQKKKEQEWKERQESRNGTSNSNGYKDRNNNGKRAIEEEDSTYKRSRGRN